MTYSESAKGMEISKARAFVEIEKHGAQDDWGMFLKEMGDKEEYLASDVLAWLGY